jgi:hypothetical protein
MFVTPSLALTLITLRPQIVQLLHDGGLTTYVFKSVQEDELIVKVRASLDRLMTQADMLGTAYVMTESL